MIRILVLCERIQATQIIAFNFNQSLIPYDKRIHFQICSGSDIKRLDYSGIRSLLLECEFLILSRWYFSDIVFDLVSEARRLGKKIFLQLDDFLFSVPKSIGREKWRFYTSKNVIDQLYSIVSLSDGIITSTSYLAAEIKRLLPTTHVFPCPYWKYFDPIYSFSSTLYQRPYPVIGYMGTQTHVEDLELVISEVDYLMSINQSLVFETFGIKMPENLLSKYPGRCSTVAKVHNYDEFQSVLSGLGWWVGLAPLTENQFNYCKSNTKFVEYIQAGIPVIASNYGPYDDIPRFSNSPHPKTWVEQIEIALLSSRQRNCLYKKQLEYCFQFTDANLLTEFYRGLAA